MRTSTFIESLVYSNKAIVFSLSAYNKPLLSGTIPLKRVKYSSKQETDAINNFKILQSSFKKLNVDQVTTTHPLNGGNSQLQIISERRDRQAGEGEVPGQLRVPAVVQEVL